MSVGWMPVVGARQVSRVSGLGYILPAARYQPRGALDRYGILRGCDGCVGDCGSCALAGASPRIVRRALRGLGGGETVTSAMATNAIVLDDGTVVRVFPDGSTTVEAPTPSATAADAGSPVPIPQSWYGSSQDTAVNVSRSAVTQIPLPKPQAAAWLNQALFAGLPNKYLVVGAGLGLLGFTALRKKGRR